MAEFKFRWIIEGRSDGDDWEDIGEFQDWCEDVADASAESVDDIVAIFECCDWHITKSEKLD